MKSIVTLLLLAAAALNVACAQGNYEIQVYGVDTVESGNTMFEIHSNLTANGHRAMPGGVASTDHAIHETLEITQGINNWTEVGFYVFSSAQSDLGWQWVGDHIRPRVRVPPEWHWPVGLSLSQEIGYQRARYSLDTWSWEIRPIVDKQMGRPYWSINPALERTLHGPDVNLGLDFSPAIKVSWDFTKVFTGGVEYYRDYGSIRAIAPLRDQQQPVAVGARTTRTAVNRRVVVKLRKNRLWSGVALSETKIKEKSLVRTFTSFLNREPRPGAQASTCDREKLRKKAWYALLLLSLTGAASGAETSMFHFQAIPQHNGLSKKMAPVDGSRLKPE